MVTVAPCAYSTEHLFRNTTKSFNEFVHIVSPFREMPASQKTALEAVMEADQERIKLEKLAEELALIEEDDAQDYLMEVG